MVIHLLALPCTLQHRHTFTTVSYECPSATAPQQQQPSRLIKVHFRAPSGTVTSATATTECPSAMAFKRPQKQPIRALKRPAPQCINTPVDSNSTKEIDLCTLRRFYKGDYFHCEATYQQALQRYKLQAMQPHRFTITNTRFQNNHQQVHNNQQQYKAPRSYSRSDYTTKSTKTNMPIRHSTCTRFTTQYHTLHAESERE